ncbi:MAG: Flp pilus assembly complex ATPase component TadA [Acidobacteria bacterium]|jgi:type II secretory ATPase GspE/PulE/Tfp pilus assembly ATPase PilB-like protein|nr:Flp pilus assembly complex ATPase component TadA [Acidobacteriota bacterium]
MELKAGAIVVASAAVLLAFMVRLARWLDGREERRRREQLARERALIRAAREEDHNPGGPLTEKQARKLLEDILQAAIRQKADTLLIDSLSGRPQVRLCMEGKYQELTGVGDTESFRRLVAAARSCAGLPVTPTTSPGGRGSFQRLYRKGHLRSGRWQIEEGENLFSYYEVSRRNRAVRFDLESFPAPGGEALKISLRPEMPVEDTRFNLGFAAAAERKYIEAVHARSGIVLLTGPCNAGKSTATYRALSLLRDEGRKIITIEWPIEWRLPDISQYWVREGKSWQDFDDRLDKCLRRAIARKPAVLMLQNIDWISDRSAQLALDYAALGGLLITAIHVSDCASGLSWTLRRHFWNRRQEAADLFKVVVAPRRLFMVCMHCAEEHRVPAKIFREAGMDDPPVGSDGKVATWRGRGCPACENKGTLGAIVVYETLDLIGEMKRFIENENDWNWEQVDYLRRQAWLHGMRTHRELALERVLAGDISLQQALLNTEKPRWLAAAQKARKKANG